MRAFQLLVSSVLSVACTSAGSAYPAHGFGQADEEEVVWAAVLTTFVGDSTNQIVVRDSANAIPAGIVDGQALLQRFPEASAELIRSFVEANARTRPLPLFSGMDVPVLRVGEEALAPFRSAGNPDEYWMAFNASYPASPGLIRLSRVGFDRSLEHALVFVTHQCGGRCGSGTYALLSKVNEEWVVIDRWVVVVS